MLGTLHKIISISRHMPAHRRGLGMLERAGNVIQWVANGLAAAVMLLGVVMGIMDPKHSDLIFCEALLMAGGLWGIGRVVNYVLTGR